MTDALTPYSAPLFRFSVLQSLTAIACLGCLFTFGMDPGMHVATASATFVFCSMGNSALAEQSKTESGRRF